MENLEGYIPIDEAIRIAKEHGVPWGASTIQQNGSRGLYYQQKINGLLHVERESYMRIMEAEAETPSI